MRNQSWLEDGTLVIDLEFYWDDTTLMVHDHILVEDREATAEEIVYFNQMEG